MTEKTPPPTVCADDDVLTQIVGQTASLVAQEVDVLLGQLRTDSLARQGHLMPLLVRGTSTAALEAVERGEPAQAVMPLVRLAAGAWLALILLSLDQDDALPALPDPPEGGF